jgi:hypothetical protein
MLGHDEGPALQTDAYIDALLGRHAGLPVVVPTDEMLPPKGMRRAIELLERALPRVHPSFLFEERLAAQLRAAAKADEQRPPLGDLGELIVLPIPDGRQVALGAGGAAGVMDRRLIVGGAIASTVSLAGAAAMLAWRRARSRRRWLD